MKTETVLIPSTEPTPVRYEINNEWMVEKAFQNRMDLLELKLRIAQDDITIDKRRNETLPSVTMRYEYKMNGLGSSRVDSYDLLFDNDFKDHSVLLLVSMPLGNKAAKSRLRRAKYGRTRTLTRRDSKKAEIKKDVLKRIAQIEAGWERILATRQATIHKEQQYQAEKRRFSLGLDTSIDLLRVQTDLAEVQRLEIRALTDYQKSLVDLAVATGTFLGPSKVQWEPFVPQDTF
jgi:outer membrane protein TolC